MLGKVSPYPLKRTFGRVLRENPCPVHIHTFDANSDLAILLLDIQVGFAKDHEEIACTCLRLAELRYRRNDIELHRGTYRVRGAMSSTSFRRSRSGMRYAVRVELFDEEIESLCYFDPLTGEILRRVPRLTAYPKTHYVTARETLLHAIDGIQEELEQPLRELETAGKLVEAQRLEQRTRFGE